MATGLLHSVAMEIIWLATDINFLRWLIANILSYDHVCQEISIRLMAPILKISDIGNFVSTDFLLTCTGLHLNHGITIVLETWPFNRVKWANGGHLRKWRHIKIARTFDLGLRWFHELLTPIMLLDIRTNVSFWAPLAPIIFTCCRSTIYICKPLQRVNSFSVRTVTVRQNLTSTDVRFWRIYRRSPHCKNKKIFLSAVDP